jgi:biopolymer transport protein ExbD
MIDILLVLLIIFILAMNRQVLTVQLPAAVGTAPAATPLVLTVSPGPRYEINRRPVPANVLHATLTELLRERPDRVLFIDGDRRLRYQDVVTALDLAKGAGALVAVKTR